MRIPSLLCTLLLAAAGAILPGAQPVRAQADGAEARRVEALDVVVRSGAVARGLLPAPYADPDSAVRVLESAVSAGTGDATLWNALARERTALGIMAASDPVQQAQLRRAVEAGREAVRTDSLSADAHFWLAASLGLLADVSGGRAKISFARESWETARVALALDPDHPGAHHIMGRLHRGARRLSWMSRLIAGALGLGDVLEDASWESAEDHLRLAAEAEAGTLMYRVELARLLAERDRTDEARRILDGVLARTPRHAFDRHFLEVARQDREALRPG